VLLLQPLRAGCRHPAPPRRRPNHLKRKERRGCGGGCAAVAATSSCNKIVMPTREHFWSISVCLVYLALTGNGGADDLRGCLVMLLILIH
jgi:hypothetical protein